MVEIHITGNAKEIAALALALQERQVRVSGIEVRDAVIQNLQSQQAQVKSTSLR